MGRVLRVQRAHIVISHICGPKADQPSTLAGCAIPTMWVFRTRRRDRVLHIDVEPRVVMTDTVPGAAPRNAGTPKSFRTGLALITLGALVVRVVNVLLTTRPLGLEDPSYYHLQANLLADSAGFRDPFSWYFFKRAIPTAFHPPLFSTVLAVPSWLGFRTPLEHRLTACVIGATIVIGIGVLGRYLGGNRLGLIAAGIAALYPNLWQIDGLLFSEGLAASLVVVALLLAYRLRERPRFPTAIGLGGAIGLAALTRPETILLLVILATPIALRARAMRTSRRLALAAACIAATALILAPWLVRNLTSFEKPVLFSTNGDAVIGVANCPETYYNKGLLGYWAPCARTIDTRPVRAPGGKPRVQKYEESVNAANLRDAGMEYLWSHRGRFATVVVWARLARVWDLYPHPVNTVRLSESEGRYHNVAVVALITYWIVLALAIAGAIVLHRRRGPPLWPLLTPLVVVCVVAVYAYGAVRFRAVAEPSLILLAAVAVDAMLGRHAGRRTEVVDQPGESSSPALIQ